jgi:hypothetical protein
MPERVDFSSATNAESDSLPCMSDLRLFASLELEATGSRKLISDKSRVEKMVESFLSVPSLGAATNATFDDKKPKKVTPKTRAAFAATGKDGLIEYYDHASPSPEQAASVQFTLYDQYFKVFAGICGPALAQHRESALDDLARAIGESASVWSGRATVSKGAVFAQYGSGPRPYARLRVPRGNALFPQRSLVTFLDRGYQKAAEVFDALTEPAPAHAQITAHGELVEMRWAKTLDDQEIAQASTWHDCWIRRTKTERDNMFNELGDQKVFVGGAKPRAPFVLYNPLLKLGCIAANVTAGGGLEEAAWNQACAILKARVLPDGDPIEKVWLVLPSRDQAIALHDRVVAAGFESAIYLTSRSTPWDPMPKGPWLLESTDNGPPAPLET